MIHIDFDIVTYRVGCACDNRHYIYKGIRWDSKTELNKQLKKDGVDAMSIPSQIDPEPWESVKDTLVKFIEERIIDRMKDDYVGYVSGKGNFRYREATILPYKGNRDPSARPHHYDAIRQFLVDVYGARVSQDMEADDAIGLAHNPDTDIIATVDKDLNCIPGVHYNWDTDQCTYISELEADRFFFKQMMTGDDTDNILGLYGVGPKSKLLDPIMEMTNPADMSTYVISEYTKRFGSHAPLFYLENSKLLWIKQKRPCPM